MDRWQTVNGRKTKYEPLANQAASKLIGSMTYLGELPYSAHEYTLRAIIFCDGINHFVDNNEKFGLMVLSCSYMMAHDVELIPKYDFLNNDVLIQFKKIPME